MKKITNLDELQLAIDALERDRAIDESELKIEFKHTYENINPLTILKNILSDFTTLPELKGNMLDMSVSLVAGHITRKIIVGDSHDPLRQIMGSMVQVGMTNFISNNADNIQAVGVEIFHHLVGNSENEA